MNHRDELFESTVPAPMEPNPESENQGISPGEHFLESAIQLGWLNGLTAEEISRYLRMPREEVESIIGTDRPQT